jgi:hypothetical protein
MARSATFDRQFPADTVIWCVFVRDVTFFADDMAQEQCLTSTGLPDVVGYWWIS